MHSKSKKKEAGKKKRRSKKETASKKKNASCEKREAGNPPPQKMQAARRQDPRHETPDKRRAGLVVQDPRKTFLLSSPLPSFLRALPHIARSAKGRSAKRNSQFSPLRPANRNSHCAKRYPPFESGGTRRAALEGRNTQNSHTRNSHDPQFTTSFLRTFRPYYVRTFLRSYIPPAQRPYPRYLRSVFPSVPAFGLSLVLVFCWQVGTCVRFFPRYLRSVFPSVPAFGFSLGTCGEGVQFLLLLLAILSSFLSQGGKCTQEEGMGNVESKKKRSKERPRFFEW